MIFSFNVTNFYPESVGTSANNTPLASYNNTPLPTSKPPLGPAKAGRQKQSDKEEVEDDEEEKQRHLKRNRQAAVRCRQKKRENLERLENSVTQLEAENDLLQKEIAAYREEILRIRTLILTHRNCPNHS